MILKDICQVDWGNTNLTKASYVENGEYLAVSAAGCDGRINHYECEANVPVLSAIGAQCGKMFFPNERFTAIKNTITLTPKDGVLGKYLYYLFTVIELPKRGAGQPFISKGDIEKFSIPKISPIATQKKIVDKIDAIFAEIDTATAATEANAMNAEALFQSFLVNQFTRISKENKPLKLSNYIKLEYGKGLDDSDRDLSGIYGAYGANGIKSKTNKFLYDKPSIVVGRKGSAGELTLVQDKFWALDVTYYVTHDTEKTDLFFLYYALKMLNIPSLAKGIKPGINRNDVYDLSISVPTLCEQKLLVENILHANKNLDIAKNSYKSKCIELAFLKQSILQQAFSGELLSIRDRLSESRNFIKSVDESIIKSSGFVIV